MTRIVPRLKVPKLMSNCLGLKNQTEKIHLRQGSSDDPHLLEQKLKMIILMCQLRMEKYIAKT